MLERGVAALMLASFVQGARCARTYSQVFIHPLVGRAGDRAFERVTVGRDALREGIVRTGTRCPTAAHHGVRGPGWNGTAGDFRRRRGRRSDASSGASGMDFGPPRHRRARLRAIRFRGGSGVAAVLLALLMTYEGRCSSALVTSSGVERCAALLTIRRVQRVAHIW